MKRTRLTAALLALLLLLTLLTTLACAAPAEKAGNAAKRIGAAEKITVKDDIVVKDDHSAFLEIGYPSIDLIDFDFGSAPGLNDWWHTPNDTLDKISAASLLVSGRLTAEILNTLQQ